MSIRRVVISNYRNYEFADIKILSKCIFIYGANGAGKTNLLESISLLSAGSGIKNANFDEIVKNNADNSVNEKNWTVFVELSKLDNICSIGIEGGNKLRKIKINHKNGSIADLNKIVKILYFIPGMDRIFINPSNDRRRFLNNLVSVFDSDYVENVLNYEKLVKERMKILQTYYNQNQDSADKWLSIIEKKITDLSVKIELSRLIFITNMNHYSDVQSVFPTVKFFLMSKIFDKTPKIIEEIPLYNDAKFSINEFFRVFYDRNQQLLSGIIDEHYAVLKKNRHLDFLSKKTHFGCHRSDFSAYAYNVNANQASTGQQKIIVLSILLSTIKAYMKLNSEKSVILLLDEIIAHIDDDHKFALFNEIAKMLNSSDGNNYENLQIFMTSTERGFFDTLKDKINIDAEVFHVANNVCSVD